MALKRIFKDKSKLDFDYVPKKLIHREKHLKRLFTLFEQVHEARLSQTAFIYGSVGTGKTALAKRFSSDFTEEAEKKGAAMDFILVNCRKRNTESAVLLNLVRHYQPNFPDRGFSTTEMLDIFGKDIHKRRVHNIVILDEADVLIKKAGSDLIYKLSRFDEDRLEEGNKHLSLILISQQNVLDMFDPASLSTFKRGNIIQLNKYTQKELFDILDIRANLALQPDAIDPDTLELISDIASEDGDARYAIELLDMAGMLTVEEGEDIIGAEHVRSAKAHTRSFVTESKLKELDLHKMILLLSIAQALAKEAYVSTGDVEKKYRLVCEEYGTQARVHTQVWKFVTERVNEDQTRLRLTHTVCWFSQTGGRQ